MKKWTWQWFILLAILGMLFSCGAWIDRQPYDIYEDVGGGPNCLDSLRKK